METRRSKRIKLQQDGADHGNPEKKRGKSLVDAPASSRPSLNPSSAVASTDKVNASHSSVPKPIFSSNLSDASKSESNNHRPRRTNVAGCRESVRQSRDFSFSSSSSSPEDSDDFNDDEHIRNIVTKKSARMRAKRSASGISFPERVANESPSSSSSDNFESTSSDEQDRKNVSKKKSRTMSAFRKQSKTKSKTQKDSGDINWPKCRKSSIARKTGNPSGSQVVKSSLRIASKLKPQQPWKKNIAGYEADRQFAKGERRMAEYRIVAESFSRGKVVEVSYDECFKVHEEMKKAYHEGRKIIEAIEKKEKATMNDERGSSSEDEWGEIENFHPTIDDNIEVALEKGEDGIEKDWWVVYLRQEVNKRIRDMWENTHKVHIMCFLAHLKFVVRISLDESLIPSLMLSQVPNGYLRFVGKTIPMDVMQKLVSWYRDAFRPIDRSIVQTTAARENSEEHSARFLGTNRLLRLIDLKSFETDLDRATLFFCLLSGMEAIARICVNSRVIGRKWEENNQASVKEELEQKNRMFITTSSEISTGEQEVNKKATKKKTAELPEERNYWVEYWTPLEKKWICVDLLHKTIDKPLSIHESSAKPMSYVFAVDNQKGICDVTQRYAPDFVKQEFRRRRTDTKWIHETLNLPLFLADECRKKCEKMQMHEELINRPLPTTMSEFKNHPLYVLEKDLLKFEAIYPPPNKQKPIGHIRGHKVFPRSTVFTLQGENNWLKLARSVKIGETPYKVVKARPNLKVPVEERVDQFLNVFGFWQTEPYRRPPLLLGKIPCNQYGNVYMFNENMCPLQCVHLKLTGLVQIARKLDKQCVPAVVGWAFDGGWTHPVIDGAIVLEKDAEVFRREWRKIETGRVDREEKRRVDRVNENWRKLIKGIVRASHIKKQFKSNNTMKFVEKTSRIGGVQSEAGDRSLVVENSVSLIPLEGFTLDDFMTKKTNFNKRA